MPQNELCCIILRRLLRRILGMCSAQRDSPGLIGSDCMFPLPGADSADDNAASKSQFKACSHFSELVSPSNGVMRALSPPSPPMSKNLMTRFSMRPDVISIQSAPVRPHSPSLVCALI
eukprot:18609-Rhodomonas_salina.1